MKQYKQLHLWTKWKCSRIINTYLLHKSTNATAATAVTMATTSKATTTPTAVPTSGLSEGGGAPGKGAVTEEGVERYVVGGIPFYNIVDMTNMQLCMSFEHFIAEIASIACMEGLTTLTDGATSTGYCFICVHSDSHCVL